MLFARYGFVDLLILATRIRMTLIVRASIVIGDINISGAREVVNSIMNAGG